MKNKPINTHCPWSGKAVSPADSTIQYRGQTVGFCNPDCRDKFASAIQMFDSAIDEARKPVLEPTVIPSYQPRAIQFDQILALDDIRLKLYHVTTTADDPVDAGIANKANAFVRKHLPEKIVNSGGNHGVGYVILHRGNTDHWLLMNWWGGGDICLASLGRLQGGQAGFVSVDDTNVNACVWEHVVVNHERDAWVRTMMTGEPNIDAYLNDRLVDGPY